MKVMVKRVAIILVLAAIIAAVYFAYRHWLQVPPLPQGLLQANGRIEGDCAVVASKFGGHVTQLTAREGDNVSAGQLLLQLDDVQVRAKVEQAQKNVEAVAAKVSALQRKRQQDARDAKRFIDLSKEGTATHHQSEQASLALDITDSEINAANAQLAAAKAAQKEAESVLQDLVIAAPSAGTITARMVEVGEVVAPGAPLYCIVNLDALYLKVYVPENFIGKVRRDLPARIYIDALPDQPFPAKVGYIASNAEFTPKEVQTPDERVKLVYAVKLYLDENPQHRLTPGLPADAVIRWQEGAAWAKPRW